MTAAAVQSAQPAARHQKPSKTHNSFQVRLRNMCRSLEGFDWFEKMPSSAVLTDDPTNEKLVLFVELSGGSVVAVDERAGAEAFDVGELQVILSELEAHDADDAAKAGPGETSTVRLTTARQSSHRWLPTRTVAEYVLRRDATLASLVRVLRGQTDGSEHVGAKVPVSAWGGADEPAAAAGDLGDLAAAVAAADEDGSRRSGSSRSRAPVAKKGKKRKKKKAGPDAAFGMDAAAAWVDGALGGDPAARPAPPASPDARKFPAAGTGAAAAAAARRRREAAAEDAPALGRSRSRTLIAFGGGTTTTARLGSRTSLLSASTLHGIENGLVEISTQHRAMARLSAFFGGATDRYECSWPHTPGARVCEGIYRDTIHQHHVRRELGGQRVTAKAGEAHGGEPPSGQIDTVYANGWVTSEGPPANPRGHRACGTSCSGPVVFRECAKHHRHLKTRGRMATVRVVPVYDDPTGAVVHHAGAVADWFAPHVSFARGARPGEHVLPGDGEQEGVQVVCFTGAQLSVKAGGSALRGYAQTSHEKPVVLLPKHIKFDLGPEEQATGMVGTVHATQKVLFKKLPARLQLQILDQDARPLSSAVVALAAAVVPSNLNPLIALKVDKELRARSLRHADAADRWWDAEDAGIDVPIPGRQPDGELRVWARLEEGIALGETTKEVKVVDPMDYGGDDDTTRRLMGFGDDPQGVAAARAYLARTTLVRCAIPLAYDDESAPGPAVARLKLSFKRPAVAVTLTMVYADTLDPIVRVRREAPGKYVPLEDDDAEANAAEEATQTASLARAQSAFGKASAKAKWRLAARLALRAGGAPPPDREKNADADAAVLRAGWPMQSLSLPKRREGEANAPAGVVITVTDPESTVVLPRDLVVGYEYESESDDDDVDGEGGLPEHEPDSDDDLWKDLRGEDRRATVRLIPASVGWPLPGWKEAAGQVTLRFRKQLATVRVVLTNADDPAAKLNFEDVFKELKLGASVLADGVFTDAGVQLAIPGRTPDACWPMVLALTEGVSCSRAQVARPGSLAFEDVDATNTTGVDPKCALCHLDAPLRSGSTTTLRLTIVPPPAAVTVVPLDAVTGDELDGGPDGWLAALLHVSAPLAAASAVSAWGDLARAAREAAALEKGRVRLVVHRAAGIRFLATAAPMGWELEPCAAVSSPRERRGAGSPTSRSPRASPREEILVPLDKRWPASGWQFPPLFYVRLRKQAALMNLRIYDEVSKQQIAPGLIGDVTVTLEPSKDGDAEDDEEDDEEDEAWKKALVAPDALRDEWAATAPEFVEPVDVPLPGFEALKVVRIAVKLADGTPLGGPHLFELECGATRELKLALPLDAAAPRVTVAPWLVDPGTLEHYGEGSTVGVETGGDDDDAGRPLVDASDGWLFENATWDPAPPLDKVDLGAGGCVFRVSREASCQFTSVARGRNLWPGYTFIESEDMDGTSLQLRRPRPLPATPQLVNHVATSDSKSPRSGRHGVVPTVAMGNPNSTKSRMFKSFVAVAGPRQGRPPEGFLTVTFEKQPAHVIVRTAWRADPTRAAPLLGAKRFFVAGIRLDVAGDLDNATEGVPIHVPGVGTRERAPETDALVVAERTRGWAVAGVLASPPYEWDEEALALAAAPDRTWVADCVDAEDHESVEFAARASANATTWVTILLDDSALWKRLTALWLSNRLSRMFRSKLATLVVHVQWQSNGLRAPLDAMDLLNLGPAIPGKPERDLIEPHRRHLREHAAQKTLVPTRPSKMSFVAEAALAASKSDEDGPAPGTHADASARLAARLLRRKVVALDPGSQHKIMVLGTRDVRSITDLVRSRGYTCTLEVEVLVDGKRSSFQEHAGETDTATLPLMAQTTTVLRVKICDEPLFMRFTIRRMSRRWLDFREQTVSVVAAVLASEGPPSEGVEVSAPLVGGDWILNGLKLEPAPHYAHVYLGPGFPVRLRATDVSKVSLCATRPGYELAGLDVTYAPVLGAAPTRPRRVDAVEDEDGSAPTASVELQPRRATVRALLRRTTAKIKFEVCFETTGKPVPIETLRGVAVAAAPGRYKGATSSAAARPSREWIGQETFSLDHARELEVHVATLGTAEAPPHADVQVAVAASRSWEIIDILAPEQAAAATAAVAPAATAASASASGETPEDAAERAHATHDEAPQTGAETFFLQRRTSHSTTVRVHAGRTVLVRVLVSDTKLYFSLCMRRYMRRAFPSTYVRPKRWRWAHVPGSAPFKSLYTGNVRGDESDPRTWGQKKKGWMTSTGKDGKTYYTYTDYTSTSTAGFSSKPGKDDKIRRKEWRRNLLERRRKRDAQEHRAQIEAENRGTGGHAFDANELLNAHMQPDSPPKTPFSHRSDAELAHLDAEVAELLSPAMSPATSPAKTPAKKSPARGRASP